MLEADDPEGIVEDGEFMRVPTSKFRELKAKAESKGRKTVEQRMNQVLSAHGFSSLDAMAAGFVDLSKRFADLETRSTTVTSPDPKNPPAGVPGIVPPATPPAAPVAGFAPPGGAPPPEQRRYDGDARDRIRKEKERNAQAIAEAQRLQTEATAQRDQYARDLETYKKHQVVRDSLIRANCVDPDYTLGLYAKATEKLKPEDLEKFDLATWTETVKKERPFLFQAAVVPQPAVTGPAGAPPSPPSPAQTTGAAADGAKVDYRTMTPDQLKRSLAEQGIRPGSK